MNDTAPKPFVFVLMPFKKEFDDVYNLGIRPACEAAGGYCERVDEQIFEGSVVYRIYNQIATAALVISDMSERNPNVFYETGYAHALNKRVILVTKNSSDIPFDLMNYPHVVYGESITQLKDELTRRVRWYVEHPEATLPSQASDLQFFVEGRSLRNRVFRLRKRGHELTSGQVAMHVQVDVHNPNDTMRSPVQVACVAPLSFHVGTADRVTLPGGQSHLYMLRDFGELLPYAWGHFVLSITWAPPRGARGTVSARGRFALRVFSEVQVRDIPFAVVARAIEKPKITRPKGLPRD